MHFRPWWQVASVVSTLMIGLIALASTTLADEAFNVIRSINPQAANSELDLAEWRVTEPTKLGSRATRTLPVTRIIQSADLYYAAEEGSSRWLVGTARAEAYGPTREIQIFRAFDSLSALSAAASYPPLPTGQTAQVREVIRFGEQPAAMTNFEGSTYVLLAGGDVWKIDSQGSRHTHILRSNEYLDPQRGTYLLGGIAIDSIGRIYIAVNQQAYRGLPITNSVTIYRTTRVIEGLPAVPLSWFHTVYPWGLEPYAFGVGRMNFGPDGMLYVASGARTDAGEIGTDGRFWRGGEHDLTSCLWRLDPTSVDPQITIFADGIRRCGGFAWDNADHLLATDCSPDVGRPAELNLLRRGAHYGFPFYFSREVTAAYRNAPSPPGNVEFIPPLANIGPAGGGSPANPAYTLEAFSRPWDVDYVDSTTASSLAGSFLVSRLGNAVEQEEAETVGFDVLQVRLKPQGSDTVAQIDSLLTGVARPIDVALAGGDVFYLLERSRAVHPDKFADLLPGRLLEVRIGR